MIYTSFEPLRMIQHNSNKTAWLFPGQGSQSVGMGRKLLQVFPGAREIISRAEEYSSLRILEVIQRGPDSTLIRSEYVQPAIVALSCAYVDLLRSAGESPQAVAGHSLGEYSALYAADVLSLSDTIKLAAERGRLMAASAGGGMIAVKSVPLEQLEAMIETVHAGTVCMANYNSHSQLVVSGDEPGLEALVQLVRAAKGEVVKLNVSGAWHSPLVAVAAHEFQKILSSVHFKTPRIPVFIASVATAMTSPSDIKSAMMTQMTSPVRWYELIERMHQESFNHFVEVGPGKVLKGLMRRIIADEKSYQCEGVEHAATIDGLCARISPRIPSGIQPV